MFLFLTVVILIARDTGRPLAISGQKRKQTANTFLANKNQWMVLFNFYFCYARILAIKNCNQLYFYTTFYISDKKLIQKLITIFYTRTIL